MKYLAIIATRDFAQFWHIANRDFLELSNGNKLLIWQKDDELSFADYKNKIVEKINGSSDFELGVIFHKLNGDADANTFRESLKIAFNDKLAFCEWYSSNKTDFWIETDANAELPYNNLKKAWKEHIGDKAKAFEVVWDYFFGDPEEETLTDDIFNAIYEQRGEDAIERAVSIRDKHIKGKGKN